VISDHILAEAHLPPAARQIARHHHERIDGTGYPDRLRGDEIPLAARIVHVADAYDALTTDRPYRLGTHVRAALDALREGEGTQFCPLVLAELEAIYREEPQLLAGPLRAVQVA
jgi:HD-GYP domain-containing protein (c-di-GMP phosphodiesterase class II)